MGIYYEFLWQQHFNLIIRLSSKPLQCLENQTLCFSELDPCSDLEFTCCKIQTASFDFAFVLWRTQCFHMFSIFLLETMDTTKKQVMRGLQICKE